MGLVVDGSMNLWTHIWHPPQIFLQGRMISQREREHGIEICQRTKPGDMERTLNLRLLLVMVFIS